MNSYNKAIEYIYGLNKYGIKLGLKNITYLLSLFDNPHLKTKVIHIAGTNGKGSTAAILSSILKSARFKVGLYTSPHLVHFQERMRINGEFISKEDVCNLLERIKPAINQVATTEGYQHPTFFEVITTMAFLYFFENDVDFSIMEVGLGGRLDATNVSQPLVSVISHIDYDHMDRLGNTLTEIAREKGAIIKNKIFVVNAQQFPEVHEVIKTIADERQAALYSVGQEIKPILIQSDLQGNYFHYSGIYNNFNDLYIPLVGEYQIENASLSIGVAELINNKGYPIRENNITDGLKNTRWPGRFEIVQDKPMVILDGAHNPNGVTQFTKNLKKFIPAKRIIAIIGIFSDKDFPGIIKNIVPFVDQVILTMANNPRATPTHILAREVARYLAREKIIEKPTVDSAIQTSLKIAQEDDVICVTGSLYTVGEAKAYFLKNKNNQ
jgi:dihydrofolate synthase / folylpolyglutamate synthase